MNIWKFFFYFHHDWEIVEKLWLYLYYQKEKKNLGKEKKNWVLPGKKDIEDIEEDIFNSNIKKI